MRAAIYTRISNDRADQRSESPARQEHLCKAYCEAKGWDVAGVYSDIGISAFEDRVRPGLESLKAAAARREFDIVLIWKLDRISRRAGVTHQLVSLLTEHDVGFASLTETIDTSTASGRMFLGMLATFAEYESENIKLRTLAGVKTAADKGKPHQGGIRPFGWQPDRMSVDEQEASAIREVAKRATDGESIFSLTREMNDRGFRTTTGNLFVPQTWTRILENPRLIGMRQHKGRLIRSELIEPILTTAEFEALQQRLGRRTVIVGEQTVSLSTGTSGPKTGQPRLLGGLLFCGCHDHQMIYRAADGLYVCKFGKATLNGEWLEQHVTRDALTALAGRALVADQEYRPTAESLRDEHTAAHERLSKLAREHYVEGKLPADIFESLRRDLTERMAQIEAELLSLEQMEITVAPDGRRGYEAWWETASVLERRNALKSIIRKIILLPDKPVRNALRESSPSTEAIRRERTKIVYDVDPADYDDPASWLRLIRKQRPARG